jgi:tetratricopeptide (TPR) repeat protein
MLTGTTSFHKGFPKLLRSESSFIPQRSCAQEAYSRISSRTRSTFLLTCIASITLLLGTSASSFCDIISFSNGTVLVVDKAWEEGDQIKYESSQGIKTIPKGTVQRIQRQRPIASPGSTPKRYGIASESAGEPTSVIKNSRATMPLNVPSKDVSDAIILRLKENVKADPDDLRSKNELIEALNSYASLQLLRGDAQAAKNSLQQALGYDKKNLMTLLNMAVLLYQTAEYRNAEDLLLGVTQHDSRNRYAHYLLGEVYYAQDKLREAMATWKTALQLRDDPAISNRLKKAEEEAGAHDELGVLQSAHFILRYDRKVSDYHLGQEILDSLERAYRQLSYDLTSYTPATITVILYPDQVYFDITRAPRWSGALFDGKIRVPVKGLSAVTSQLNSILVHELSHSFVNSLAGSSCPTWLNEGLAQLREGKSAVEHRKLLSQLQTQNQLIALTSLKGSFVGFPDGAAEVAYLEGLSATEYLIARNGKNAIGTVLDLLHQNYNFESALRSVTNQSLAEFEKSWRVSLVQ